ncbi:complement component C8 alpha chain [Oxyura jamaicensis]|uniref:complement component C8 alpha chain n=1 Tax=Oxyura jamaicensis TaxID=8884 RepID=UPI0015A67EDB|nr:complement component C8 alpha chain [Oxyura jamaicensis]XP_035189461.1 complement component C8 alpha chain [Oxyura jamaicensis]XP_035189463.1 complement component C8 alpha chain [Oxyura jamaicensis]
MRWSLRQVSPLMLAVCSLSLTARQGTAAAHGEPAAAPSQRRSSRDVNSPAPVNCQLSQWSAWTDCFPCQGKRHRYRTLVQPAGFAGQRCTGNLWDEQACRAGETCTRAPSCGKDFRCEETGRCIKRHLVCNGETDCRDGSDESNCEDEDIESPCEDLYPIPGSEKAAQGYNILTQEEKQYVYDPNFGGGHCEYVYNGEWRELKYDAACERLYYMDDEKYFRKPYNFHVYQFLAHADSGFSFEFYEDSKDLLNALGSSKSRGGGFTFGIGPKSVPVMLNLGFSLSRGKGSLKNFTEYNAKDVGFIRAVTKVQTARFKMRRNNIVLDEDMLLSLQELPDTYNYGMYAKFIDTYGTHFMTSGTMGGVFEHILVVNKEEMRRKEIRSEEVMACFGLSAGVSVNKFGMGVGASVSYSQCDNKKLLEEDEQSHSAIVEDIIPRIKGGDTATSGGLLNSWDGNMYRRWGRSLKYNPAIIDFELQPIHEILRRSDLSNMETKRQHLKRALDDYLLEFNACRCGPCQNDGEPILVGDTCACQCQPGYEGHACERSRRPGTGTSGRWSCWSPWAPCQGGSRRRSRQCTNPAPQHGGAPCMGTSVQSKAC